MTGELEIELRKACLGHSRLFLRIGKPLLCCSEKIEGCKKRQGDTLLEEPRQERMECFVLVRGRGPSYYAALNSLQCWDCSAGHLSPTTVVEFPRNEKPMQVAILTPYFFLLLFLQSRILC